MTKNLLCAPGRNRRLPAILLVLVTALLLLPLLLLPRRGSFAAPPQEYENDAVKKGRILFSRPSGFYDDAFTLTIQAPTTEIYYTLDGTRPVPGQEGTYRYEGGIEISDATPRENVWSMRTDVTTAFDQDLLERYGDGGRTMDYQVPDAPVDKCTVLRAACRLADGTLSEAETASYFVGFSGREGYEGILNESDSNDGTLEDEPLGDSTLEDEILEDVPSGPENGAGTSTVPDTDTNTITGTAAPAAGAAAAPRIISIVTDPANLFDHEKGIYVTGRTFDDFKDADAFHDGSLWYRRIWWWWDANYHNRGRDWERPADIQFFGADGALLLQQEAGIRIQGGGSRGFLPKSLNLYARRDYGGNTAFHCDFFGTGYAPKRMTLTSSGDDCYTKLKDRMAAELAAGQGFSTMHYEPCLLFLDGEFWGFYYLTEKYDEKYFSFYYDVPEEEVIEIKNGELESASAQDAASDGGTQAQDAADLALYTQMKDFIENSDMAVPENYEKACSLLDMDSFINYYAVLIYCARCGDWPQGNFALWRTRNAPAAAAAGAENAGSFFDGRWRWVLFDVNSAAISPGLAEHDTLRYVLDNRSMRLFSSLWENASFRARFTARILEYGQTIFTPDAVNAALDAYVADMAAPMAMHYRRFFGGVSGLDFPQIVRNELRDFFEKRYDVVEKMLAEYR